MRSLNKLAGSAAVLLTIMLLPGASSAQETSPPTKPTSGASETAKAPSNLAPLGADPRVDIVTREQGVMKQDAEAQLALTDKFEQEIGALSSKFSGNYLTSIIQYGKPLSITIVLDRDVDLGEVRQAVSADLRQFVRVKRSRISRQEIADSKRDLLAQLSPRLEALTVAFDHTTDRFVVYTPEDAVVEQVKTLIDPKLRAFVDVKKGASRPLAGIATNADDPTASDKTAVWGGWPIYFDSTSAPGCTGGFIVKDTLGGDFATLTAGHCPNLRAKLRWPTDRTFKDLTDARFDQVGGSYDFQTHWGAYLSSSGYFWIDNDVSGTYRYGCTLQGTNCKAGSFRNIYNGVSGAGYVGVTGAIQGTSWSSYGYNDNHTVGSFRCKYGMVTGVTCGTISHPEVSSTVNGVDGTYEVQNFVRVAISSSYPAALAKGDSGGPVFAITSTTSAFPTATAAGISSGGNVQSTGVIKDWRPCAPSLDGSCFMDYMPIDRINDSYPLAIASSASSTPIEVN